MKRLQIMLDEHLDEELRCRAAEEGVSIAALIRRLLSSGLRPAQPLVDDTIYAQVGVDDYPMAGVDDVVYR